MSKSKYNPLTDEDEGQYGMPSYEVVRSNASNELYLLIPAQEQAYHLESGAPYRCRLGFFSKGYKIIGHAAGLWDAQEKFLDIL